MDAAFAIGPMLLKWTIRLSIVIAAIIVFIALMSFGISFQSAILNQNILSDLLALIQVWLPFDLNVVLLWMTTVITLYILYMLARAAVIWLNRVIGNE